MRRWICGLCLVALIFTMIPTSLAAESGGGFCFRLSVDGKTEQVVSPGAIITVTFRLTYGGSYTMYGMQNEIRYDSRFFELVPGSVMLRAGVETAELGREGSSRELYMNYLDRSGGGVWEADELVGSFQLKVLAESGSSTISNQDYLVSNRDGTHPYGATCENVTISLESEEAEAFPVHFQSAGGSKVPDQQVAAGQKVIRPQDPAREGYVFVGWYKDAGKKTPWDFEQDTVQGETTLYAKWEKAEGNAEDGWFVTFDTQGGSPVPYQRVKTGEKVQKPQDPTQADRSFRGWYKEAACTTPWDFETDTVQQDTVLYAKWDKPRGNSETGWYVFFDSRGGSPVPDQKVQNGQKVTKPQDPTREGQTFQGWFLERESKTPWDFETGVVTEDLTLYAGWKDGGQPGKPEDDPYHIYTIKFETGTPGEVPEQYLLKGQRVDRPRDPFKEGYDFIGWYKDRNCREEWLFYEDTVEKDTVIYARFEKLLGYEQKPETGKPGGGGSKPDSKPGTQPGSGGGSKPGGSHRPGGGGGGGYWPKPKPEVPPEVEPEVTPEVKPVTPRPDLPELPTENIQLEEKKEMDPRLWLPIGLGTAGGAAVLALILLLTRKKISFEVEGGTPVKLQRVFRGRFVGRPPEPTRADSLFAGWYTDPQRTQRWDFERSKVKDHMTLYAKWL